MRPLPRNFHAVDHHDANPPPHRFVLFPARTVLPFLRTPLGYQTANIGNAISAAMFLSFVPLVFWALYAGVGGHHPPDNIGHIPLMVFAVASLALYCIIFTRRAIGQKKGEQFHTAEAGYSYLAWHTELPVWLCEQVIVPAGLAAVGWIIAHTFSFELGWWLVVCAVSYLVMARWEYTRRLAQTRMTVDDMIRAQAFEDRLTGHERQASRAQQARPGYGAAPASAYAFSDEPDMVALGGEQDTLVRPPDVATWSADGGSQPSGLSWLRRARGLGRR